MSATLVELFEEQVARTPDATAIWFPGASITYSALDAQANRLAWRLIAEGIGPEDSVAIALERSPQMIVAVLAVLKSGAAYLPLDPGHPPDRLTLAIRRRK